MQRINWADPSLSGGLFEKIVGCLLGNEHRHAVRVRPAQGDGGVDVVIPISDGVIDVHQVKHYPNRLHWPKIQESLNRLAGGTWLGRTVRVWYLTVPKQPTPQDLTKLDEMTASLPFEIHWFGEDELVALAARRPEVGDYYLGDGRVQLERCIEDWQSCLASMRNGESPRIENAQARLTEIASALGRNDPHLEYGVDVHPAGHDPGTVARPGALLMSSCAVGGHVVACHAYPRYRGAEEDAADRLHLCLDLRPEARARVAEAIALGGDPVELAPADIVGYQLPAVGHQIPAGAQFSARLTPLVDTTAAVLRLVLTTKEGQRTVVRFTRRSFTQGSEGATSIWVSPEQCFEMRLVVDEARQRGHLSIRRTTDFEGAITDVAGDIKLMRALQPGTTVALTPAYGSVEDAAVTVTLTDSLVDPTFVAVLDALRVIQDHTVATVIMPDEVTGKTVIDLVETAALLEGLATTGDMRSTTISVTLQKSLLGPEGPQDVFGDHFTLAVSCSAGSELALPHQSIQLPRELLFVRVFRTARVATIDDTDTDSEYATVTLEPGSIPIWIDQRIDRRDDFTDALHQELLQHAVPVNVDDLVAQLAGRGSEPSA